MKIILYSYIMNFLHPFKAHRFYQAKRNGEKVSWDGAYPLVNLQLSEAIGISWFFFILSTIYNVIGIRLGLGHFVPEGLSEHLNHFASGAGSVVLFMVQAIFYPLLLWIQVMLLGVVYKSCISIVGTDEDLDLGMRDVLNNVLSMNTVLAIPVLGPAISGLLLIFSLFVGFKENLKLGSFQSLLTLILPLILLIIVIVMLMTMGVIIGNLISFV